MKKHRLPTPAQVKPSHRLSVLHTLGLAAWLVSACGAPVESEAGSGQSSAASVSTHPVAWLPPKAPSGHGVYAPNNKLAGLERFGAIGRSGPETVTFGPDGGLYTGYEDGTIVRYDRDGKNAKTIAQTGGRPLGLHPLKDGKLIVADAERGLLQVALDGDVQVLAAGYGGAAFTFVDDAAISPDESTVYFTEASDRFGLADYTRDILEHSGQGRLFRYDRSSGAVTLLRTGFNFANGLIVAPDGHSLLIDESGSYRVVRYWLDGPKQGQSEDFAANLPGYPDNITFNGKDRIWVALARPREALLDQLGGPLPCLRKLIAKLPDQLVDALTPKQSQAVALDLNGTVVDYLEYTGADAYTPITTVLEADDGFYFGSLTQPSLGRLLKPKS